MIERSLEPLIERWLFRKKVVVLYGARQVGKTTLARRILQKHGAESGYFNCEIPSVQAYLDTKEPSRLRQMIGNQKIVVFDEAQHIPEVGRILKILTDTFPDLQVIATGSSSFELANRTGESLTGRAIRFILYPFSYAEVRKVYTVPDLAAQLQRFLVYGMYPEIVTASDQDAQLLLDEIAERYLYKDVLMFENLKRADILLKLLQLLALQVGNEISLNELANSLQTNRRTVERYIDLLEKAFVIFRLGSFSRNLRKEIRKGFKVYFYDVGIRNSIIQQYQPIENRNDKGALWENFLIAERMKFLQVQQIRPNQYFWRTHDQQEIDYLEEYNGRLTGYELKWQLRKQKLPKAFLETYPEGEVKFVDRTNFRDFLTS